MDVNTLPDALRNDTLFQCGHCSRKHSEGYVPRNSELDAGRLFELLQAGEEAAAIGNSLTSPFWILDVLYLQVLSSVRNILGEAALAQLRCILGAVVLAKEQLSPAALEALLNLDPGTVSCFLSRLSAILILPAPGDEALPIRLIHTSFVNFIVDQSRCTQRAFLITPVIHHAILAKGCLRALVTLQHNICDVDPKHHRLLNSEIPDLQEKIAWHLTPERQYAVKFWSYHLVHAEIDKQLMDTLQVFCDDHLLDWLEALSLLGCMDVAIAALQSAQQLLKVSTTTCPFLVTPCKDLTVFGCTEVVSPTYRYPDTVVRLRAHRPRILCRHPHVLLRSSQGHDHVRPATLGTPSTA
ncbi:hypothetical protein NUW54_g10454 [Trametes sanguinea]|uniref:Uncharacterized protein n=1 Tax=Trametes sanguinea TaxID=158606 RepID=A0ACC1P090_9APHY|nr:hypothetical protein NUW54_g10454 [Trametes sanguinea]